MDYLEESKLCRKLRDFGCRYKNPNDGSTKSLDENSAAVLKTQPISSKFDKLLKSIKPPSNNGRSKSVNASMLGENVENKLENAHRTLETTPISAPLYQFKEFLEALTSKAEDARIIILPKSGQSDYAKQAQFAYFMFYCCFL